MKLAIKKHIGDVLAIVALVALSIAVAGYILDHERLRFPLIESAPFKMYAQFSTAQAVMPGQGQTVRVSGVQIGDIGSVTLKNGLAVVEMDIDQSYKHLIHQDATALLRPRTGLKDMFIELDPGSKRAPIAKPGYTIPVANTLPDVKLDEVLSSLDADTRAYLTLLVNGAGRGLEGNGGNELAQVLERFEPTHRDLARVSRAVAARATNLRRLVNSLARLNTAVAARQGQVSQLVDSSSAVFRAFASEDQNVSRAIADLPGTLSRRERCLPPTGRSPRWRAPTRRRAAPARRARSSATRSGRSSTRRGRSSKICAPPRSTSRRPARTWRRCSGSSTTSSTCSATRPAVPSTAICGGWRGSVTTRARCSPCRTRTAPIAPCSSSSAAHR
jgi:phospholipid/cholesterol/gamma-HCH transport system substrate-binding protein